MDLSDVTRKVPEGLEADILVSPRSSRSGLDGFDEWRKRIIVRAKAPPLNGKANKEIEELMKGLTGCRSEIISGHLNRQKTVLIFGDSEKIFSTLEELI